MSPRAQEHADRGSFWVSQEEVKRLGVGGPRPFRVKANMLLIANTFGVHARGNAEPGSSRQAPKGKSRWAW